MNFDEKQKKELDQVRDVVLKIIESKGLNQPDTFYIGVTAAIQRGVNLGMSPQQSLSNIVDLVSELVLALTVEGLKEKEHKTTTH